ncbi:MAG TPA: hypothetical protein VM348_01010, partial [Brevundimonas sp.]|nr:hypothetical protein [Brevundimonas sp.]
GLVQGGGGRFVDRGRAAPPAVHEPTATPLHEASSAGLRPALSSGAAAPMDMQPIDAVPVVDTHGVEAVSASNG